MTGMTKAELEAEVARLQQENDQLRAGGQVPRPNTQPVDREPSFGMSEGERQEIEATGRAHSPWTGKRRTADDLPDGVEIDPNARQQEQTRPTGPDTVVGDQQNPDA